MPRDPQFRFWGSIDPRGRTKPPILAEAPTPAVGVDGVAVMRLYDPIDSWGEFWGVSAAEFTAALDTLPPSTSRIQLHINSPGGEVYEAVAILNALRRFPAPVTAVVDGIAASAASFIAAGADEVVAGRNTEMMIHDAWGIVIGPAADMRFMADRLDALSNNIAGIYKDQAGGTVDEWRALMLAETWFSADEAVAAGIADRVEDPTAAGIGEPVDELRARFDLKAFRHAGRDQAPPPLAPAAKAGREAPGVSRPAAAAPVVDTLAERFAARPRPTRS